MGRYLVDAASHAVGTALRLCADAQRYIEANQLGLAARVPDLSHAGARARADEARRLLGDLETLDRDALPSPLRLTIEMAEHRADLWAQQADWYWTVFDPTGTDLPGMFAPTAYCGGHMLNGVLERCRRAPVHDDAARYHHLARIVEFATVLDQLAERTAGQHSRGIVMPGLQAEQAAPLLVSLRARAASELRVGDDRLPGQDLFKAEVGRLVDDVVGAAFDRFIETVGPDYVGAAGDGVGIGGLPDGPDIYRALVRFHTSSGMTPAEVHALGLERIAYIRTAMAAIRAEVGFDGDDLQYRARLDADPRWRADTADGIAAVFEGYMGRFARVYDAYFPRRIDDAYGVAPLPDALTASMTFGYFRSATEEDPVGRYLFNARNLAQAGLVNIGPLTYHELVPGHHLQGSWHRANSALHPVRRYSGSSAFVEGWAEYGVALADELGLFEEPAERFGRLVAEAFLACRLVVDTGMNALGWSLEQARDYMRSNSFIGETEIRSETLRYGCDIPGQALAYKVGDRDILRQRERVRRALGPAFDLRAFHGLLLDAGPLPMPSLDRHVGEFIDMARQRADVPASETEWAVA